MRKGLLIAVAAALLAPAAASAHPCDIPPVMQAPSAEVLGPLGVLRSPPGPDDLAPKDIRETQGRPYATAMRHIEVAGLGAGAWVIPLYDISERFLPTEACIRTLPKRFRGEMRRRKQASRGVPRHEGLALVLDGEGDGSHGTAIGGLDVVAEGGFAVLTDADDSRRTRLIGLVPDGVASVRIELRDHRGRPVPRGTATATVRENAYGVDLPVRWDDGVMTEERVTMLDAAGAVVKPR